jgi:signal transduction histidine kinase
LIRLSLRRRIEVILAAFVFITFCGGLVLVWYTFRMEGILLAITERDLKAFQGAETLENALINQKGFVSYFFIDGNPGWLTQLGHWRQKFSEQLPRVAKQAESAAEREAVHQIETEYANYISKKDRVIEYYKAGSTGFGIELHQEVRQHFERLIMLCNQFKEFHAERIREARRQSQDQAVRLRIAASAAVIAAISLALLLGFVLVYQILTPLRKLAAEADKEGVSVKPENEVKALSRTVRDLLVDVDKTQSELERSRESLVQSEKMALVGKLAAGMAHGLRNPFTSVKMRLFSLGRSLELDEAQKDDFAVISAEIRHIDTIVQNFLEFARPPKLKMQPLSPSTAVDAALQLLEHRLNSYDVEVTVDRPLPLPQVSADPEQLKEVLANIIVNACEAMGRSGHILIEERTDIDPAVKAAAVVRIRDSGPGIPAALLENVFQPFFTTKEEGTGLGLSIAQRIILDHGGRIEAESAAGQGAVFTITLPVQETADENDPDH